MGKPLKFFVTGAAGFVGRHVCEILISSGFQVSAVVRTNDIELLQIGVDLSIGDLWDKKILQKAVANAEVIVHCAGNARFGDGAHYRRDNTELTEHLISVVSEFAGNARFVYVSTIGAVDREPKDLCALPLSEANANFPSTDYGKSKLLSEELVRCSGLGFSIIRPSLVIGESMRTDSHFSVFARQALAGALFARLKWPGKISVIHVKDLASAILKISIDERANGQTYFCAGDIVSIKDYFDQCSPFDWRIPLPFASLIARSVIRWVPFKLKVILLPALTASDEKLQALGWRPKYSSQIALSEVIKREKSRKDPEISPGGQTVITGAASGLGRSLAIKLSSKRDHLLLVDKDQAELIKLASQLKNCRISIVDLSEERSIEELLNSLNWRMYKITELFACAGVGIRGEMQNISIADHRKMFAVNVLARIALAKDVIEKMEKHHFGRVILISSSSAFQPMPYMATYAASNSALLSIGEAWNIETSGKGVHVMSVCPGGMQTKFQKTSGVKTADIKSLMLPEHVAEEIIGGLRYHKATQIISLRSFTMSILARILPRAMSAKLWGKLMEKLR
jgi:short-subunit dehydrogenase